MDLFVTARSICDWADNLGARATLPQVVRRLVLATATGIDRIDFPALDSSQRPGFDGVIECAAGNAWVPTGRSIWELSTQKDVLRKADGDFCKRTQETSREEQGRTVYIFLTPRRFSQKNDWGKQKAIATSWREVRAYDADDLEQWAEAAPSGINAWFGRQIGTRPYGVDDVAQFWTGISKAASCELLPAVFLAGREKSVERVRQWLAAEPRLLAIDCRSPVEVIDFFCAVVVAMPEQDRLMAESRAVVVKDTKAWSALRDAVTRSVLVVDPSLPLLTEETARAVANGHHVLVATEPTVLGEPSGTELERASEFELTKALEESGYSPAKALQSARAAGGSLAILKHHLAPSSSKPLPPWASDFSPEVIAACLLLGGWGINEYDQLAFAEIAGRNFADCEAELQRMATSREPLLLHAAGKWRLISKDHAWSLFEDRVAPAALKRFETLALDILADDDPRYLLAEDERFYANIRGHVPKYSETIKKHVAETLAFLGAFGSRLEAASTINVEAAVDRIVASVLPATCTWHRWASLGARLPLLAEASPMSFLRAIREDLRGAEPELVKLLHEEEESFFGRCNHAGLLWALETLAWPTEHVGEVAQILLALADRDKGKKRWANRPASSLCEILLYWLPHTTATVDQRVQLLDLLINENREAVWPILLHLLPESVGGTSMPTHQPYWRAWADNWVRGVSREESLKFITATANRIIREAGVDSARWTDIFARVGQLPYTVRQHFLEAADSFCKCEITDCERRMLAEELAKQINRHQHFQDAHWALPEEMLADLARILERLKPQSPVLRNAPLFDNCPDHFFKDGNFDECQAALAKARQDAIREILESAGLAGIGSLVEHAKSPYDVGCALATTTGDEYLRDLIPSRLVGGQPDLSFAAGFISNRYWPDNWEWADKAILLCPTANTTANFLICLRFSPEVWYRASLAGEETSDLYWSRCGAFNPNLDSQAISAAVEELCRHDRPAAAINLLSMAIHQNRDLSSNTLLAPLESLLNLGGGSAEGQVNRVEGHCARARIEQIIGALQRCADIDEDRLARVEWHYIRCLGRHSEHAPRTLQKHLSSSPDFFNELLRLCYRSDRDTDAGTPREPSANDRYMAEHAFHLLHEWDRVPGMRDDDTVDEALLRDWCKRARQLAEEAGRLGVCDIHIGELFSKSKQHDDDGAWPCRAVRRVASEIATEALADGMSCGISNLRGATFRGSGGDQERNLADDFRQRANRIRFESPFVAQVLDSVAKGYEREAKWWDERDRWEK